jgi:hypothetical protein
LIKTSVDDPKKFRLSTEGINGPATSRRFRKLVDHIKNRAEFGRLILDKARWMDKTKHYKQDEICRKIKNKLRKEIVQHKISERCIERCLPSKYKRKYIRSEVSSVSKDEKLLIANTQRGKTLEEKQPISNYHEGSAISENGSRAIKDDNQNDVHELIDVLDKLQLRDQINKLSYEFDCMLDIISNARKENQEELLLEFRSLLERIIDSANHRIAVSAPLQFGTHIQRDKQ